MSRFAAPIAEQIWDMKYRFKDADGTPRDMTVEDSWRRIARDLAQVEKAPEAWEQTFFEALEDFKFLPRGIYLRAFIKTYCGVLGLEAKVILDEFVEKYPDHWRTTYGRNLLGRAFLDNGQAREAVMDEALGFIENLKQAPEPPDAAV